MEMVKIFLTVQNLMEITDKEEMIGELIENYIHDDIYLFYIIQKVLLHFNKCQKSKFICYPFKNKGSIG